MNAASSTKVMPPLQTAIRVAKYDRVTSWLIALITVFVAGVLVLSTMVITRPRFEVRVETVPVHFETPGGDPHGTTTDRKLAGGSALEVELGSDDRAEVIPRDEPAVIAREAPEFLSSFVPLSQSNGRGVGGSGGVSQTHGRRIGEGTGKGGFPREQRWFVRYSDTSSLDEYARQLDFFGIELGAIVNKELVYVSRMSSGSPQVRRASGGSGEKRLYFTWQGGSRKAADVALFRKAEVNVGESVIFQFYPAETENVLAEVERQYEKRAFNQIRRTYFAVRRAENGEGYEFFVTRQIPVR